jgi:PASTA domain
MNDDTGVEDRLRELLRDPGWSLPPRPDAPARIRRAARWQRIRTASTTACAVAVVAAAIAGPLTLSRGGGPASAPGTTHSVAAGAPSPAKHPAPLRVMPSVIGMKLAFAEKVIHHALPATHFIVRLDATSAVRAGIVIAQTPVTGSHIRPGERVTLVVSAAK